MHENRMSVIRLATKFKKIEDEAQEKVLVEQKI